jgi:hypothetical protein
MLVVVMVGLVVGQTLRLLGWETHPAHLHLKETMVELEFRPQVAAQTLVAVAVAVQVQLVAMAHKLLVVMVATALPHLFLDRQ